MEQQRQRTRLGIMRAGLIPRPRLHDHAREEDKRQEDQGGRERDPRPHDAHARLGLGNQTSHGLAAALDAVGSHHSPHGLGDVGEDAFDAVKSNIAPLVDLFDNAAGAGTGAGAD